MTLWMRTESSSEWWRWRVLGSAMDSMRVRGKGLRVRRRGRKTAAELVRRFDVSFADPERPVTMRFTIAWIVHDFWVLVEILNGGGSRVLSEQ